MAFRGGGGGKQSPGGASARRSTSKAPAGCRPVFVHRGKATRVKAGASQRQPTPANINRRQDSQARPSNVRQASGPYNESGHGTEELINPV